MFKGEIHYIPNCFGAHYHATIQFSKFNYTILANTEGDVSFTLKHMTSKQTNVVQQCIINSKLKMGESLRSITKSSSVLYLRARDLMRKYDLFITLGQSFANDLCFFLLHKLLFCLCILEIPVIVILKNRNKLQEMLVIDIYSSVLFIVYVTYTSLMSLYASCVQVIKYMIHGILNFS